MNVIGTPTWDLVESNPTCARLSACFGALLQLSALDANDSVLSCSEQVKRGEYEQGRMKGVPLNYVAAYAWYSRAATAGQNLASKRLRSLSHLMTPKQVVEANNFLDTKTIER